MPSVRRVLKEGEHVRACFGDSLPAIRGRSVDEYEISWVEGEELAEVDLAR